MNDSIKQFKCVMCEKITWEISGYQEFPMCHDCDIGEDNWIEDLDAYYEKYNKRNEVNQDEG